jgi:PKD repeat protein
VVGHDIDGDSLSYSLISGVGGIDANTGAYSFHALDGVASHTINVRVSDGHVDSFFDVFFDISVANVAPTLGVTGPAISLEGETYTVNLSVSDPGQDTLTGWTIDWGDGSSSNHAGNASSAGHVYATAGNYSISATASDEDGSYAASGPTVNVNAITFQITAFTLSDNGFHLDFNRAPDLSVLNLYSGTDAVMGASDLLFTRTGDPSPIRGSLIMDDDLLGATFIKATGVLDAGNYSLTLYSRADGWRANADRLLDGNSDGSAGDNYSRAFSLGANGSAILGTARVLAGPGQSLVGYAPGNNVLPLDGLPITLNNAAGVTSASFQLSYDTSLFNLTSVSFVNGVSGSYSIAGGLVSISLTTPALATNNTYELARFNGSVPLGAISQYGAKQVLDLHDAVLSGGRAVRIDDGLHVNAYPGDTSGNGDYDTADITRMQRISSMLDTGYGYYPLVDPGIIGDVNHDQQFSAIDRVLLSSELSYLSNPVFNAAKDRKEIAAIPAHVPITFTGADPLVDLPRDLAAVAGGIVTVPVRLDTAQDLDQVQLRLAWNASQLQLLDVRRGSLTGDFGQYLENRQGDSLTVDMSRLEKMAGGSGTLLELDFRVAADAHGTLDLDLQWAQLNQTRLTLNPAPQAGVDPTDGAIRVTPTDIPVIASPARTSDVSRYDGFASVIANPAPASSLINFASRYNGFAFKAGDDKGWLGNWLTDSKSKKPNLEALRIQPKLAAKLSARL